MTYLPEKLKNEPAALELDTWYELKVKPGCSYNNILHPLTRTHEVSLVYKDEWISRPIFKKNPRSMYMNLCLVFSLEGIANGCTKTLELENAQSVHFEKAIKDKAFKVTLEKGDLKIQWMPK